MSERKRESDSWIRVADLLGPLNEAETRSAPDVLYTRGNLGLLKGTVRVSVVGSRKPSERGVALARGIARLLVTEKIVVVSGLAEGIDAQAHVESMESGGSTVAVLGTPLSQSYPRANRQLQEQIGDSHLIVTQFPDGHPVQRGNFPRRNRTMALLVHASIIVEAADSSGTLSQGWEAIRLGRPLFLSKLVVDNTALEWPAEMLSYGAEVLDEPDQLLSVLPARNVGPLALDQIA
ncbi:MAG: DNA-processing protein DprA [Planctomycetes bacterium]|nr:DNA-processing protein DprA [Planctomycetota bacterium]